jgi:hypothetical protein
MSEKMDVVVEGKEGVLPGVVGAGDPKLQSLKIGTWKGVPPLTVTLTFGGEQADDTRTAEHRAAMNKMNISMALIDLARVKR